MILAVLVVSALLPAVPSSAGPPPAPSVEFSQRIDLAPGQTVTATAEGLNSGPGSVAFVMQCARPVAGGYVCGNVGTVVQGSGSSFTGTVEVLREFTARGGVDVDCSLDRCSLAVAVISPTLELLGGVGAPITFLPDLSDLTVTVTPSTGLVSEQAVQVAVSGIPPGKLIFLLQCPATGLINEDAESCEVDLFVILSPGAIPRPNRTTQMNVRSMIGVTGPAAVDCLAVQCEIRALVVGAAGALTYYGAARAPISFAAV